jgi:hypothetical protein
VQHFEALVAADWSEADQRFWDEMRDLQTELELAGRFGGGEHKFQRDRLCKQDMNRRTDLLARKAEEVLLASGGAAREVGERIRELSLRRMEEHIEKMQEQLDDSKRAGRYRPFGPPPLPREEILAALDARLFLLLARSESVD